MVRRAAIGMPLMALAVAVGGAAQAVPRKVAMAACMAVAVAQGVTAETMAGSAAKG